MTKRTNAADPSPKDRTLTAPPSRRDMTKGEHVAELLVAGTATNALTVASFAAGAHGEVDLTEVFRALQADGRAVKAGDLSGIEAVLSSQVVALNVIFGELARRAALNMGEYLDATDKYLRLALKAQSQCRTTAETLAVIKQGPPIFAKQANVSHGPQQVNNGDMRPSAGARARWKTESINPELLSASDGNGQDTGAVGAGRAANREVTS